MAVDTEVGALIGGIVGGGLVLVIFVAVIIYLFCGKRRQKKEEEREKQHKFHHLTPHTSPAHSQPSTLNRGPSQPPPPVPDPQRLPKVGSYGLWVGAPGIYANTPSPAYAYSAGRVGGRSHHLMQPAVMHRASSDTRLPLGRGSAAAVYSTGVSQQRIYHSQGIPSHLSPVYEFRDPLNGSVYDVYQIDGGSTTSLLRDNSNKQGKGAKRLQRSQSDVVTVEPPRRGYRTKPTSAELRASRASSNRTSPASTDTEIPHSPKTSHPGDVDKPVLIESVKKIVEEGKVAVVASATDSMKLLAKNKTDDQKTVDHSSASESGALSDPESRPLSGNVSPVSSPTPASSSLHYSYQGDIYAVPDKEAIRGRPQSVRSEEDEARFSEIIAADPVADITERAQSLLVEDNTPDVVPAPVVQKGTVQNPIYQEVGDLHDYEEPSLTHSSVYEEVGVLNLGQSEEEEEENKIVAGASVAGDSGSSSSSREVHVTSVHTGGSSGVHPQEVSTGQPREASGSREEVAAASAAASVDSTVGEVGASGHTEGQQPGAGGGGGVERRRGKLQEQWSYESEGTSDNEASRAGKHISVTAEAFQFLDTYLSDEDGTDVQSPPLSPVSTGRRELL
ncbi:hypothetical protein ACOMHN_046174 [Nucella lapillus]